MKEVLKDKNKNNIEEYLKDIIEKIYCLEVLKIEKDNKNYLLYSQDKLICKAKLNRFDFCYDYLLNIFEDNIIYSFFIEDAGDKLILYLRDYYLTKEDISYHIIDLGYGFCIRLIGQEKGIEINYEGRNIDKDTLLKMFAKVDLNISIEEIYQKFAPFIQENTLKIRKYNINSSRNTKEENTDVLTIKRNSVEEFMNTKIINNKKYVIKKENNNYSITCYNAEACELNSSYLVFEDSIDFVKKLEKRKKYL